MNEDATQETAATAAPAPEAQSRIGHRIRYRIPTTQQESLGIQPGELDAEGTIAAEIAHDAGGDVVNLRFAYGKPPMKVGFATNVSKGNEVAQWREAPAEPTAPTTEAPAGDEPV